METLMHTCCAPCSVSCIRQLRGEGIEPVSFWYNPNIHPYQEYKARRTTGAATATISACGKRRGMQRSTAMPASPAPCSSAPIRTTSCCGRRLRRRQRHTG